MQMDEKFRGTLLSGHIALRISTKDWNRLVDEMEDDQYDKTS